METLESLINKKVILRSGIEFTPDFRIAVQSKKNGGTHILIHPFGHNGASLNFIVKKNKLTPYRSLL